ncbi:DUF6503 family protein [Echinicola jeungdonensis]|uniref:DUF6503 family protein n=1 Tax=Echinicola jeungdonensis TaxID=709343 RepID=A0ABV5J7G6_9BACT
MVNCFQALLWALVFLMVANGCNKPEKAQSIVDQSIAAHGWEGKNKFSLQFKFREIYYTMNRDGGRFEYIREFKNPDGQRVRDILNNQGFQRYIDGIEVEVTEEMAQAYSNSINSVFYFMLLPYGLNDPAVNKKWLKTTKIEGEKYDLIHVTFDKEGGGVDYEDEYFYWFDKKTKMMDYLAYLYHSDGGGLRFRKAINRRKIQGITIQDYINYEADPNVVKLKDLGRLYNQGKLKGLSRVINENVQITVD